MLEWNSRNSNTPNSFTYFKGLRLYTWKAVNLKTTLRHLLDISSNEQVATNTSKMLTRGLKDYLEVEDITAMGQHCLHSCKRSQDKQIMTCKSGHRVCASLSSEKHLTFGSPQIHCHRLCQRPYNFSVHAKQESNPQVRQSICTTVQITAVVWHTLP